MKRMDVRKCQSDAYLNVRLKAFCLAEQLGRSDTKLVLFKEKSPCITFQN